jgi:hypothetical protein
MKAEEVVDVKYDPSLQDSYFRFAAEEILRRQLKRDAERLSTN